MTEIAEGAVGLAWRPELALVVERDPLVAFTEVVAESCQGDGPPRAVHELLRRGMPVVPHGISLSLGSAEPPDRGRLRRLARLARTLDAPFVSEHVAFVRAGGVDVGHLTPIPHTAAMLDVLVDNVLRACDALPVPLALENVASVFRWPEDDLAEADLFAELLERTPARMLLDVSNLHANAQNHGLDALAYLDRLPLARVAYVHVAGGIVRDGVYHDTHTHPVPADAFALVDALRRRGCHAPVLLERDDDFRDLDGLRSELRRLAPAAEPRVHAHG